MLKKQWFVVRLGYIVGKFDSLEKAESYMASKGWREYRDDVSIVCYDR